MEWQREWDVAVLAAKASGKLLLGSMRERGLVLSDQGKDIKLEADKKSESKIIDLLQQETPYPVLSEERGLVPGKEKEISGLRWIVDPLDGTMNYHRGIPFCCLSIALWKDNVPLIGVVYDFMHDDLYESIVGEWARLKSSPLKGGDIKEASKGVLATGFPVRFDYSKGAIEGFIGKVQRFKKVRFLGSAALSMAYVACGKIDAYEEENIMIWDIAGGAALIKGIGGYLDITFSPENPHVCHVRCSMHEDIWK